MSLFLRNKTPDLSKSVTALGTTFATVATLAFFTLSVPLKAQTTLEELRAHPEYTASNYLPYPEPDQNVKYTEPPAGYKPFYISHYGRHGSRYHHSADEYKYIFEILSKADSAGKLTAKGKEILAAAQILAQKAAPRAGDLTQVGAKQHEGIARRMAKNFPEMFQARELITQQKSSSGKLTLKTVKVTPHVDAYASTSGRCIVSMSAFAAGLRSVAPEVDVSFESGKDLMKFICTFDWNDMDYTRAKNYTAESDKLWAAADPMPIMKRLFSDSSYVAANMDANVFYNRLFEIYSSLLGMDENLLQEIRNVNVGGKSNETSGGKNAGTSRDVPASSKAMADGKKNAFENLFTVDESITRWQAQNAWWYSLLGTSPLQQTTKGIDYAKGTLQHIIDEADKVIAAMNKPEASGQQDSKQNTNGPEISPTTATLRFGHDAGLLPLAGLMQLSIASAKVSDLSKLYEQWNDFRVIPMGANLQIIFYKKGEDFKPTAAVKKPKKRAKMTLPEEKTDANPADEILVKFLYNEQEITAPIPCEENYPVAPYYRWNDVRNFYNKILAR